MKTFKEADLLARKTLDAGPVGQERPCDCISFRGKPLQHDGRLGVGYWVVDACDCQNYDDARYAQDWCAAENGVAKVRNLILELTK